MSRVSLILWICIIHLRVRVNFQLCCCFVRALSKLLSCRMAQQGPGSIPGQWPVQVWVCLERKYVRVGQMWATASSDLVPFSTGKSRHGLWGKTVVRSLAATIFSDLNFSRRLRSYMQGETWLWTHKSSANPHTAQFGVLELVVNFEIALNSELLSLPWDTEFKVRTIKFSTSSKLSSGTSHSRFMCFIENWVVDYESTYCEY